MSKPDQQPAIRHISDTLVNRMLKLEQLFHERYLTADLLSELVKTYVQAIECFDGTYSPMRKYFLSRIQFVVSQPEIDNMLTRNVDHTNMIDMIRETVRLTNQKGKNEEQQTRQMLMEAIEAENKKYRKIHEKNLKANKEKSQQASQSNPFYITSPDKSSHQAEEVKHSKQKKPVHHDKKIQLEMNVMRQVSQNIKNFKKEEDKKIIKQTKRINAIMEEQNNTLEARLAMRKKAKNRKKSIDEKFVQQVVQIMPMIQKEELKNAQREIEQAVVRMTARLTLRQGTTKGSTGLIIATNSNPDQKYRGRIKIKNQVKEVIDDDEDLTVVDPSKNKTQEAPQKQPKKGAPEEQKPTEQRSSDNGTGRFTLGLEGGRGRIKKRDTTRMDEDDQELI